MQTFIQLPPHRSTLDFKNPAWPLTAATESTGTGEPSRYQTLRVPVCGNGIETLSSFNSADRTFPDSSEDLRQLVQMGTPQSIRNKSDQIKAMYTWTFYSLLFISIQEFLSQAETQCQWTSHVIISLDTIELVWLNELGLISWTVEIECLYTACTNKMH